MVSEPTPDLRTIYEQRADDYIYRGGDGFPARKHKGILEQLRGRAPERFLEVGCGDGPYVAWATGEGFPWCMGVDLSARILQQARKRVSHEGDPARAWLGVCDACALPVADASVDLVLCTQVIEHVLDDQAAMSELARVLRPGGCLVVSTDHDGNRITQLLHVPLLVIRRLLRKPVWHPPFPHRSYSRQEFPELVRGAGLVVDHVSTYRFSWPARWSRHRGLVRLLDAVEGQLIRRQPFCRWGDILLVVASKQL